MDDIFVAELPKMVDRETGPWRCWQCGRFMGLSIVWDCGAAADAVVTAACCQKCKTMLVVGEHVEKHTA